MALHIDGEPGAPRRSRALRAVLMSGLAGVLAASLIQPADAYSFSLFGDPGVSQPPAPKRKRVNQRRPKTPVEHKSTAQREPEKKALNPLMVIVSIKSQKVWLYARGELVTQSIVSTGTPGHDTPVGVFSVIEKDRHHRSNIYSAAPMPYMQRITWSGVALHQGLVTGRPASHGCIRLQQPFAMRLWDLTQLGVRVIVSPEDVAPHAITHDKLFVAKPKPAPVAALQPDPVPTAKIRLANSATTDSPTVPVVDVAPDNDPLADGRALTEEIRAEIAAEAGKPAAETAAAPAADAAAPAAETPAEPVTGSVTEPAKETVAAPAAETAPVKAAEPVAVPEPVKTAEPAAEAAPARQAATVPALEVEKPRALDKGKLRASGKEFPLRPGPITVFVSRSLGKVFVRKGFWPVFEAPVKIANPEQPFGTHVFTALEQKGDGSMRWNVVSMSNVASRDRRSAAHRQIISPAKPADVLDRITIPDEALDRISELMTAGASFIVSDLGISPETVTRGTDIIVQVR